MGANWTRGFHRCYFFSKNKNKKKRLGEEGKGGEKEASSFPT